MLSVRRRIAPSLALRVSIVIVANASETYFVHKRSDDKKVFPNLYGVGIGGKVEPHESHEEAAHRELQEELGIEGRLTYQFHFAYQSPSLSYEGAIYSLEHNGEVTPSTSEFQSWRWMTKDEIRNLARKAKLCPDTKVFFQRYLNFITTNM